MVRLRANSIRVVDETAQSGFEEETLASGAGFAEAQGPDHVGAWLREAREATGRDLRDVAGHLRIRYPYLLAIEEGRFDDLPGRAYAVGFIRSYSDHLGLDAEKMVALYKSEADAVAPDQNLKFPTPAPEGRFPGSGVLLASALLAAALVGGWYYYQSRDAVEIVRVPSPPGDSAPAAAGGSSNGAIGPAQAANGASAPESAGTGSGSAAMPVPQVATRTEPTPAPATAEPAPMTADSAPPADGGATVEAMRPETVASEPAPTVPTPTVPIPTEPSAIETAQPEPLRAETMGAVEQMAPAEPVAAAPADPEPMPSTSAAAETMPAAPAEPAAPTADSDTMTAAPQSATPEAAPEPAAVAETEAAPAEEPVAPPVEIASLPAVPTVTQDAAPAGRVYGLTNREARIVLTARSDCWIQISDAGQDVVFTRVLAAGESYRVPDRDGLTMRAGNPSALDVEIDGGSAFRLSYSDQPAIDIALDPQRLRNGTAIR